MGFLRVLDNYLGELGFKPSVSDSRVACRDGGTKALQVEAAADAEAGHPESTCVVWRHVVTDGWRRVAAGETDQPEHAGLLCFSRMVWPISYRPGEPWKGLLRVQGGQICASGSSLGCSVGCDRRQQRGREPGKKE